MSQVRSWPNVNPSLKGIGFRSDPSITEVVDDDEALLSRRSRRKQGSSVEGEYSAYDADDYYDDEEDWEFDDEIYPSSEGPPESNQFSVRGVKTTGLFEVPSDDVQTFTLVVFVSNFAETRRSAQVTVRRLVDGRLETLFSETVEVGPGEARRLDIENAQGETVEVSIETDSDYVIPSGAVTQFFPADGGILVVRHLSAADFVDV